MLKAGKTYTFKFDDFGIERTGTGKYIGYYTSYDDPNPYYLLEVPSNDRYGVIYSTMVTNEPVFKEQLDLIRNHYITIGVNSQFFSRQIKDITIPTIKEEQLTKLLTIYQ